MGANGRCRNPRNATGLTVPPHYRQHRSLELGNRIAPAWSPAFTDVLASVVSRATRNLSSGDQVDENDLMKWPNGMRSPGLEQSTTAKTVQDIHRCVPGYHTTGSVK